MKPLWTTKKNLVYLYQGEPPTLPELPEGFECHQVTNEVIDQYFAAETDRARAGQYRRFLGEGAVGYVVTTGERWAAAAWIAPAEAKGAPHHIPASVSRKYPWTYHAHTHPDFRRRGLHGYLVVKRLQHAAADSPGATVTVATDVGVSNTASRASHLGQGFKPAGLLTMRTLRIPYLKPKIVGRWRRSAPHPPVKEG